MTRDGTNRSPPPTENVGGSPGRDEPDQHGHRTGVRRTADLLADVAVTTVDQGDLAARIGQVGVRARLAVDRPGRAAPTDIGHVAGEPAAERRPVERRGVGIAPGDRRRGVDHERECERAGDLGLGHRQGRPGGRRGARDPGLVAAVARRRDGQHADPRGLVDGQRQVVDERRAVIRPERHVEDVEMVLGLAVVVRVDGPVDGLQQADAGARRGDRRADLEGVQLDLRGDAQLAADDVGDVGAVALEVDRVGIGLLGLGGVGVRTGPALADEVVAADDPGRREQPVEGGVLGVGVARPVGRLVGRQGARPAERLVGVVDAAVDDADLDPGALEARLLDGRATDVRDGLGQGELVVDDPGDRQDRRIPGQLGELAGVDPERDDVRGAIGPAQDSDALVELLGPGDESGLLAAVDPDLRQDRGRAAGRELGGRGAGQPDEDPDLAMDPVEGQGDLALPGDVLVEPGLGELRLLERCRQRGVRACRTLGVDPGRHDGGDEQGGRDERADRPSDHVTPFQGGACPPRGAIRGSRLGGVRAATSVRPPGSETGPPRGLACGRVLSPCVQGP